MSTFVDLWADWSARCVDPAVTPRTRTALRCAFYCGAISWASLHQKAMNDTKVSDLTRELVLENLWRELEMFEDELIVNAALRQADDGATQ